ncbi:MAG: hypothetical protein AAF297_00480 [Planctomycetota bacterium]
MQTKTMRLAALLSALTAAHAAHAAFVLPTAFGWDRGDSGSAHFQWDSFEDPSGGNFPDGGQFPTDLPNNWATPDVVELSGASFITSGGNIYSFSVATSFEVTLPNYGLEGEDRLYAGSEEAMSTSVLVQIRTLGSEVDTTSPRIGNFAPSERIELEREILGGEFGGVQVDTLFRFDLPGNLDVYTLTFNAAASSMSLDRLSIDTFVTASDFVPNAASLLSIGATSAVPAPAGLACVLGAGLVLSRRGRP